MNSRLHGRGWAAFSILLLLGSWFLSGIITPEGLDLGVSAAAAADDASPASEDKANGEKEIREQSVYIPYDKLRQVFEKHGRGVFLPYQQFEELWQTARDHVTREAEAVPPYRTLITQMESEATVEKDVVRVRSTVFIEVLAKGWNEVPLRLSDAAITSATIGGKPARILGKPGEGYRLLIQKVGKEPEQIKLELEFAKAITRSPGQNSVSFETPQAAVSRWKVVIPQSGVKVNVHPMIAATEVPADDPEATDKPEAVEGTAAQEPTDEPAMQEEMDAPADEDSAEDESGSEKPSDGESAEEEPAAEAPVAKELTEPTTEEPDDEPAEATPETKPSTEKPAEKPVEQTVLKAFVGATPTVRIEWTPKAEGATGLAALVSVQAQQRVWINEGVIRARTDLAYSISRAELGQLTIEAPSDFKVVNVVDANVRQWSVEDVDGKQRISVQLFEPAKSAQQISLELEKFIADEQAVQQLTLPVVRALDVGRQQGTIVVAVAPGLRAEATNISGLMQVDAGDRPAALREGDWAFSYRYASVPYELTLDVEKVQPRITVDTLVEAILTPEQLTLQIGALYTVERSGVFRLDLSIPEGFEVRQVRGTSLADAEAVEVDGFHLEGEKQTQLVVNLARKALGKVGLQVELHRDLAERDALSQPGKSIDIPLVMPQFDSDEIERASGRLVVYAPESLRVKPTDVQGLTDLTYDKAMEGMQSLKPGSVATGSLLSFAFAQGPAKLVLSAERRKPMITVRQMLVVQLEPGVAKYRATFDYQVLYSPVKSLRIDVPADLAPEIRNETPGIREQTIEPAPDDLGRGYVGWTFSGEFFGSRQIVLVWEQQLDKLGVGKPVDLKIPHLRPREVDRAWGQIAITKSESLDVAAPDEPKDLRPIDPQRDLATPLAGAVRAFEFYGDWELTIGVTQYELEDVQRTSIERGFVRMVVTPAEQVSVQALYRLRSVRQRIVVDLPPEAAFDTAPVRVNDRPVTLETDRQGQHFIPLTNTSADQPVLLEIRYTVPGGADVLRLPGFPQESAVQQVYLGVYLPDEQVMLGRTGPWTEDFDWRMQGPFQWSPRPYRNEQELLNWVREGVPGSQAAGENFATDGTFLLFSTLRPAPAPAGELRLAAADRDWFHAFVFGLALLGGLMLLPAPLGTRVGVLSGLVILALLAGAFAPTFTMHLFDGVLWTALAIVVLLWLAASVWQLSHRKPIAAVPVGAGPESTAAAPSEIARPLGGVGGGIDLSKQTGQGSTGGEDEPPPAAPDQGPGDQQNPEGEGRQGGSSHA